jgi:hypothetical protein
VQHRFGSDVDREGGREIRQDVGQNVVLTRCDQDRANRPTRFEQPPHDER